LEFRTGQIAVPIILKEHFITITIRSCQSSVSGLKYSFV